MHDSDRLFVDLQPPAGGLQRLQRSLANDHADSNPHRLRLAFGGALAVSLLMLGILLPGIVSQHQQTRELRSAVHAAMEPPANGIQVRDGAALELSSGNPEVRLYLVQSSIAPGQSAHDGVTHHEP